MPKDSTQPPGRLVTIRTGTILTQGEYVRTNPDGTVTIRDGAKEYTGWPV